MGVAIVVLGCGSEEIGGPAATWFWSIESVGCPGGARTVPECTVEVDVLGVPLGVNVLQRVEFEGAENMVGRLMWDGAECSVNMSGRCQIQGIFGPYGGARVVEYVYLGVGTAGDYEVGYSLMVGGRSVADTVIGLRVVE